MKPNTPQPRRSHLGVVCLFGSLTLALALPSDAATSVVPTARTDAVGGANNVAPFFTEVPGFPGGNTTGYRMQQVYASSEFAEALLITELRFRPDEGPAGQPFTADIPNFIARMTTTTSAPDALSAVFANNYGSDLTMVFSGTLSISSADIALPNGTREFDIVLTFQTPFLYDPQVGNLLIEFVNPNSLSGSSMDAHSVVGDSISRVISEDPEGTTAQYTESIGLVTQFRGTPIPEPSVAALLVVCASAFSTRRHRRKA